ncbi:unnamed protein product [Durusdinium trenchii]|uniref:FH2 domain-containing protein n=1 Tax=Durusdinium trenchii TaxID=1381693 RepID=A0ABP0S2X9_9DINO
MHWVHPRYSAPEHATVFDAEKAPVDFDALQSLLSGGLATSVRKRGPVRKTEGIKVLDASRAQNMAIVLSKLPVSSYELCDALIHLDFSLAISEDLVELLFGVLPTPEECEKLRPHASSPDALRDIEQKVLPFCSLPRAHARLRLLRLSSSHCSACAALQLRCETLRSAAAEAIGSHELRQVLAVILLIGNYINHGTKGSTDGGAQGFAIETLPAISNFKLGNVSTLHFLCLTLRRSSDSFCEDLMQSLPHVTAAGREKSCALKQSVQQFKQELDFAQRELQHFHEAVDEENNTGHTAGVDVGPLQALVAELHLESEALQKQLASAFEHCGELQRYFCTEEPTSGGVPAFENFFQCLQDFLDTFRKAWRETAPVPDRALRARLRSSGALRSGAAQRRASTARVKAKAAIRRSQTEPQASSPHGQGRSASHGGSVLGCLGNHS